MISLPNDLNSPGYPGVPNDMRGCMQLGGNPIRPEACRKYQWEKLVDEKRARPRRAYLFKKLALEKCKNCHYRLSITEEFFSIE